jgi:hypothetical protein
LCSSDILVSTSVLGRPRKDCCGADVLPLDEPGAACAINTPAREFAAWLLAAKLPAVVAATSIRRQTRKRGVFSVVARSLAVAISSCSFNIYAGLPPRPGVDPPMIPQPSMPPPKADDVADEVRYLSGR